jgi:hypothetical protein
VPELGRGNVCLQNWTLVNVFVARKSMGSPVHARSIPFIALTVTPEWLAQNDADEGR